MTRDTSSQETLRISSSLWINPCIRGKPLTPKWVILQTAETQKKCHIMRSYIYDYTVCEGKINIFRQKNKIFFLVYNLTLLCTMDYLLHFAKKE